jgi:hypothetical protein
MDGTASGSLVARAIGAAMLNVDTYEAVEADRSATGQAAVVVVVVAIASAIGAWGNGTNGALGGIISAFLGWLIWAGVTNFVGTRFFNGTADWGELLRTLGFAQAPGILLVLGIIPFFGGLISFVVGLWILVAGVVAIRQALDITTGKAIITALLSALVVIAASIVLGMVLGVGVGVGSVLTGGAG